MKINRNIVSILLKTPLVLLVFAAFIASIYASINNIQGITYPTSILFGVILIFYFIGVYIAKKHYNK